MMRSAQDALVLVFEGIDDTGNVLNDLWSYNPIMGTWKELNALYRIIGELWR
jgi:hypothetical protein